MLISHGIRGDDSRTVGSDQPGLVLPEQCVLDLDHVHLGDALGDAHDERHLGLDGLHDGSGGTRRRHVDDGGMGLDLVTRLQRKGLKVTLTRKKVR